MKIPKCSFKTGKSSLARNYGSQCEAVLSLEQDGESPERQRHREWVNERHLMATMKPDVGYGTAEPNSPGSSDNTRLVHFTSHSDFLALCSKKVSAQLSIQGGVDAVQTTAISDFQVQDSESNPESIVLQRGTFLSEETIWTCASRRKKGLNWKRRKSCLCDPQA